MMLTHATLRGLEQITDVVVSSQSHEVDVLQLSAGEAACSASLLEFADIRLVRTKFSARHRWIDTETDRSVHLVVPAKNTRSGATVNGQSYTASNLFCRAGPGTVASVTEPDFESYEVVLSEGLADDVGLPNGIVAFLNPTKAAHDQLNGLLQKAFMLSEGGEIQNSVTPEQVLHALGGVLEAAPFSTFVPSATTLNRELIISRAEAIMNDWDPEARLEIENLCRELGASRRSLYQAFRESLGIGPVAFHRLKRLHALRASLKAAEREEMLVAEIAHMHGFYELGRMAGYYKEIFGELPNETLNRRQSF
nr:helix-turn-helix domain-containing protein [uncultured Roseibium sp.]